MGELTPQDRAALDDWWHSDWPDDGGDVLDTLAETVERILAGHREALAGKVRALHKPHREQSGKVACPVCLEDYPCATVALLDAEATGEQP